MRHRPQGQKVNERKKNFFLLVQQKQKNLSFSLNNIRWNSQIFLKIVLRLNLSNGHFNCKKPIHDRAAYPKSDPRKCCKCPFWEWWSAFSSKRLFIETAFIRISTRGAFSSNLHKRCSSSKIFSTSYDIFDE